MLRCRDGPTPERLAKGGDFVPYDGEVRLLVGHRPQGPVKDKGGLREVTWAEIVISIRHLSCNAPPHSTMERIGWT